MSDATRMTDEEVRRTHRTVEFDIDFDCSCDEDDGSHTVDCEGTALEDAWNALKTDHVTARSEEARLLKENAKHAERIVHLERLVDATQALKDALAERARTDAAKQAETIRALADALAAARTAMHRGEFGDKGRDKHVPAMVDAALRLAGRL
jgi:hypothetical protein